MPLLLYIETEIKHFNKDGNLIDVTTDKIPLAEAIVSQQSQQQD